MFNERLTVRELRVIKFLPVLAAMVVLAASCASNPDAAVATSTPTKALAVNESPDGEDSLAPESYKFRVLRVESDSWDEMPDWWPEVQDVPTERLVEQDTKWAETTPSDRRASEMHLGGRVLKWRIPVDWGENCIWYNACSYGLDEDNRGTKGFVVGWGGTKPRTWSPDPASNGRELRKTLQGYGYRPNVTQGSLEL